MFAAHLSNHSDNFIHTPSAAICDNMANRSLTSAKAKCAKCTRWHYGRNPLHSAELAEHPALQLC